METKYTVLIVDDTPENLRVLGNMLELEGCEIRVAMSGQEAIENLDAGSVPDIILLDVMMHGMDGYETCKIIKSNKRTENIPVIFITALSDDANEERGLNLGAVDYIHKPFNLSLVRTRIINQLELHRYRMHLSELVDERTNELAELNANLEKRVQIEVENSLGKDYLLYKQSRLATIGETLSFIAHQWRQPLNCLGLNIQTLPLELKSGSLDTYYVDQFVKRNMTILMSLSDTIQQFQDFFNNEISESLFYPSEILQQLVTLIQPTFAEWYIPISLEIQNDVLVMGKTSVFSQAVMNIIINAKDVLLSRKVPEPLIHISCYKQDNYANIKISDNGGGIDEEIFDKIFAPYYTTKFMHQGTGVSLYVTKMVIERQMGGACNARNIDDGAEFTIQLPASSHSQQQR